MGIMLIVYGAALSSLARKFSSSLINSAELQFEKDSLLDDLSQAKERYDLCLEGSHDGIWDWDIDQREIYASPAFAEIMGVSLTGAPFPETEFVRHIHGDDRVEFQHALDAHRKGETEVLYCEFRTSGDGDNTRWVLEPIQEVVESDESFVIHCRAPETFWRGARCGRLNTGKPPHGAACVTRAI